MQNPQIRDLMRDPHSASNIDILRQKESERIQKNSPDCPVRSERKSAHQSPLEESHLDRRVFLGELVQGAVVFGVFASLGLVVMSEAAKRSAGIDLNNLLTELGDERATPDAKARSIIALQDKKLEVPGEIIALLYSRQNSDGQVAGSPANLNALAVALTSSVDSLITQPFFYKISLKDAENSTVATIKVTATNYQTLGRALSEARDAQISFIASDR